MKKLIALLLAGAMCASMAACGSKTEEPAAPAEAEAPAEEAEAPAEDADAPDGTEAPAEIGEFTTVTTSWESMRRSQDFWQRSWG